MSTFGLMFDALRAEVRAPKHSPCFTDARGRRPALARHLRVDDVLTALEDDSRHSRDHREDLAKALIAEHQSCAGATSLWSSALLVAFYPMLSRLRHRILGDLVNPDDLDQLVIAAFLEVAGRFPLDDDLDRVAMRLRQRTERQVFRALRREENEQQLLDPLEPEDVELFDEADPWPEPRDEGGPGPRNPVDAADAVSFLVERAGELLDGESVAMLTATLICRRRISAFVRQRWPELDDQERARVYQRVKRRHSRLLKRLRPSLAPLRSAEPQEPQEEVIAP